LLLSYCRTFTVIVGNLPARPLVFPTASVAGRRDEREHVGRRKWCPGGGRAPHARRRPFAWFAGGRRPRRRSAGRGAGRGLRRPPGRAIRTWVPPLRRPEGQSRQAPLRIRPEMGAPGGLRKARLAFQPSRRLTRSCSDARSASGGGWRAAVQTAPRGVTTLSTVKPEPRASFHL
jgi:hypothetical protein